MKKSLIIVSSVALMASLAACEKEANTPKPVGSSAANSGSMSDMPMPSEMQHGKGVGTVTDIDATKNMVTLDHGSISELRWPAMKMSFSIKPELLTGIKVGDKVNFEIDWDGKVGTVTKIEKSGF